MDGQVGEPGLLLTGEELWPDTGGRLDPVQHLVAVGRISDHGGDEGIQLIDLLLRGDLHRVGDCTGHSLDAGVTDGACLGDLIAQQGRLLDRMRRQRRRTDRKINDLQLGRVRSNVQHT